MKAAYRLKVMGRKPLITGVTSTPAFNNKDSHPAQQTSIKPDLIASAAYRHRTQKQGTTIHGNNHASKHRYHAVAYS